MLYLKPLSNLYKELMHIRGIQERMLKQFCIRSSCIHLGVQERIYPNSLEDNLNCFALERKKHRMLQCLK